jgi:hypothetical protein
MLAPILVLHTSDNAPKKFKGLTFVRKGEGFVSNEMKKWLGANAPKEKKMTG